MNASIQSKCDELVAAIRASILEDIGAALGKPKPLAKAKSGHVASPNGAKRSPAELAKTVGFLYQAIHAFPGERIEQIAKRMSRPTHELALPIKRLLTTNAIRKTGARRATRYFPRSK